ncbi:SGNH hydrolase-type esterase domain-containing protein [Xylaria sp. FL0933]|nr:SGNH hydrolase-type esterase domain-containing protein [Xylaria sp. FL0933]
MTLSHLLLAFQVGVSLASDSFSNQYGARAADSSVSKALDPSLVPKYTPPGPNMEITEWFAIGDSFSAGIGADVPGDMLNTACSRFKASYPNQMNQDRRLPGDSASRTFVYASCADAYVGDIGRQIITLLPNPTANFPKMEKPQIGTVSLSWEDLGFAEIFNACVYRWVGYQMDCEAALTAANENLKDTSTLFAKAILNLLITIMRTTRETNTGFELYVAGYIQPWNDFNKQCDTISWTPSYKTPTYLTTDLRQKMNALVLRLNDVIRQCVDDLEKEYGGVFFVDAFNQKFDGHRFCEEEDDQTYHRMPTDQRTWIIHHGSPYGDSLTNYSGFDTFFDVVDSILIPPKDGKSTAEQIKAVNGDLSAINSAYNSVYNMTSALNRLAQGDAKYASLPVTWNRIMHPKGSGYKEMSNAVIDEVLKHGAAAGPVDPHYPQGLHCTGKETNMFLSRDDLSNNIAAFCKDAAAQKNHDSNSGSIIRNYNSGTRYEVRLSIDWPQLLDISKDMEANCLRNMDIIMDGCDGGDPSNPLDWKHGGTLAEGWVKYDIVPTSDQDYTPGECSIHLQENEQWKGIDGPGTEREFTYSIEQATMKDGAGKIIGKLGFQPNGVDPAPVVAGDKNPLSFSSNLPDLLVMTPEARGHPRDYIQFTIGTQSWTTVMKEGSARCDLGDWTSDYSPRHRLMDCYFQC